MIAALIKYRWLLAGLSLLASIGIAWGHGYVKGKAHERASIAGKQITIMEKRNEIANNRPDTAALFDGMWNDTDW